MNVAAAPWAPRRALGDGFIRLPSHGRCWLGEVPVELPAPFSPTETVVAATGNVAQVASRRPRSLFSAVTGLRMSMYSTVENTPSHLLPLPVELLCFSCSKPSAVSWFINVMANMRSDEVISNTRYLRIALMSCFVDGSITPSYSGIP